MVDKRKESLLIVFVKSPIEGKVKTRLAKTIGDEAAVKVYKALVGFTLDLTKSIEADINLSYGDTSTYPEWNDQVDQVCIQSEGDLGQRMSNAFKNAFEEGYKKVVLIGSDCAQLSSSIINEAFEALDYNELTIGPAEDGGYYLIGKNEYHPILFEGIEWSTDEVLSQTMHRFKEANIGLEFLDMLSDVDVLQDLKKIDWLNKLI